MNEIKVRPLFSGSGGNATYIEAGGVRLLIDAGVSARRITGALKRLGCSPEELDGIFITHEHSDHVAGLRVLCKKCDIPIHITEKSYENSGISMKVITHPTVYRVDYGEVRVQSFPLSHDSACCVGYTVSAGEHRVGLMTDTGVITDEAVARLAGCEQVVIECNHDALMLKNGPYPRYLKERIASARGHLSNGDCAGFCAFLAGRGTKEFYLAHLSRENNSPDRAYAAVRDRLSGTDSKIHICGEECPL